MIRDDNNWLNKIPNDWKMKPIRALFMERKEKNVERKEKNILSLTIEQGVIPYAEKKAGGNKAKSDVKDYKIVKKDDIVMNSMNVVVGAVGKSNYNGIISPAYYILNKKDNINVDYFTNVFLCETFQKYLMGFGNGIMEKKSEKNGKLNTIRMKVPMIRINQIMVPVPDIAKQDKIAFALEKKKKIINNLIGLNIKSIELLREYLRTYITNSVLGKKLNVEKYDTNISYIGKIPLSWKVLKGKYVYKLLSREVEKNDDVITCFRDGEVTLRKNRRESGFTFSDKEIGYQGIERGDLVVHGMDGFAGAIGISDSRGKGSPVLNVLDTDQNKKYIMYFLRSLAYNDVFMALSTGIRIRSCDLSWNKLKEENIVVPPRNIQNEIVDKIEKKTKYINKIIDEKENFNKKLEEYKKSLIFEVVTGKKEI